ncbi:MULTISPECIES: NAD(P)/FAD-dependent oxidoreductase [unclassified Streptomyces]|uniref:NAD(P)/FAD-dependent oxidoreductase n=1 Tax=unclassified Streptomyces TaxID=2593676 RepID=UPI0036F17394
MSVPDSVLVVGASAAGLGTAEGLRRKGYQGRLTLLDAAPGPPHDRPPLSKQILAGIWEPERAHLRTPQALDALDAQLLFGDEAVDLEVRTRTVRTRGGRTLRADAVVLSPGLRPRRLPGLPVLRGTHVLHTLDQALALRTELGSARHVVVIGNGVLGAEIAATCAGLGLDTTLVGSGPGPMAGRLGPRIAALLAQLHIRNGVRLINSTTVSGLTHAHDRVTGVRLPGGQTLPADVVVTAIGSEPHTQWLAAGGLRLDDGIVCDAQCRAAPGIYAAGDAARFHHQELGLHMRLENRTNATTQAATVAANILGDERPYTPLPYFWTDQFDVKIQVFGTPTADAALTVVESGDDGRFVARCDGPQGATAVIGWNMPKQTRLHSQVLAPPSRLTRS